MKEHIHTIPVIEALQSPGMCAFCEMKKRLEENAIRFILGPAYMEDDVRMKTNKVGFCKRHLDAMYEEQNRLGLALMLHTHMQEVCKKAAKISGGSYKPAFFGAGTESNVAKLGEFLTKLNGECYVCESINSTFNRYIDTFFMLWAQGGDESRLIKEQKSYCMQHFAAILQYAAKLSNSKRKKFSEDILPAWQNYIKELEGDLDWFIQKFDYRNKDADWKNSKDALPRALSILGGNI